MMFLDKGSCVLFSAYSYFVVIALKHCRYDLVNYHIHR